MSPKSRDHNYWSASSKLIVVCCVLVLFLVDGLLADMQMVPAPLTACQHLRQAETRRSRALRLEPDNGRRAPVRIPKCNRAGDFEPVQCSNEIGASECWCVDEYGQEIGGTRRENDADQMRCSPESRPEESDGRNGTGQAIECPASSCRMYCPAGFARDQRTGCPRCACRDPCAGIECPGGHSCQLQEVACVNDPCPPVPTCKKARSLSDLCPAGQPLTIADTPRPFLCGHEPGKPQCPPIYRCLVQLGNDYGVCCPAGATASIRKPGQCPRPGDFPRTEYAGRLCGAPCSADLDCPNAEKCCETDGCARNCRAPSEVSACQQARVVAEMMSIGEREGRGYVPECDEHVGGYARRQCSRNGLVCWCVDPRTGHKIRDSMGAASTVSCEDGDRNGLEASVRSQSRNFGVAETSETSPNCGEPNICAAVCEYGFKIDHDGCPTCECSEPCEGFRCAAGSHCEVARDVRCASASALCASEPVCKPDLVYTNPCATGVPLASNVSGDFLYCKAAEVQSPDYQSETFWDPTNGDSDESRSLSELTECPADHSCVKLYRDGRSVCCPAPVEDESDAENAEESRPQSMCEYLRDFSDRMEGTESGMILALPSPTCKPDGHFEPRICVRKTVRVTRSQRKRMLEEQNVREMRALFERGSRRSPRSTDAQETDEPMRSAPTNLKLYKVSGDDSMVEPKLDVPALIRYLRQHGNSANREANYMAEILSRKLLSQAVQERSAKVIDAVHPVEAQLLTDEKPATAALTRSRTRTRPITNSNARRTANGQPSEDNDESLVPVEVDECYCVDGFGTEIPQTRGLNVTLGSCSALRESLECLDITCRMGCDYGFVLDAQTRCPTCECRDPCDSIECADGHECRSVEVSCEGEYCPPVPACLPRKPGQCPFLVPPGTEGSTIDSCEYECRSDQHCPGARRCCSNGCGTQCVEPQLKTACQHLQTIQLHQASEVGVPPKQKYIAQCNATTGAWLRRQCGPSGEWCWCVDAMGNELSGTRRSGGDAVAMRCDELAEAAAPVAIPTAPALQSRRNDACAEPQCGRTVCEFGQLLDEAGCRTCACRDPCAGISCPGGERCQLMRVECIDEPCPLMPVCVPQRGESVCTEGTPFRRNGQDMVCGPQSDADACPSTHSCQLDVESRRGVCCAKTRDVCFEAVDNSCAQNVSGSSLADALLMWRFSPKQNKCVQMLTARTCASKNLFHSESACSSVCPVLSACERLRLRNSLAAKRQNLSSAWFQPRCDPETGAWSPIQCLGRSAPADHDERRSPNGVSRAFSVPEPNALDAPEGDAVGVCWCADKKGAPLHGSLTRGTEPTCNHRQARRRQHLLTDETPASDRSSAILRDPMIEQLIGQITLIADEDQLIQSAFDDDRLLYDNNIHNDAAVAAVTERIMAIAYATDHASVDASGDEIVPQPLRVERTRCEAIRDSAAGAAAAFPVRCTADGAFAAMQCNDESVCWCVDMAGNQLPLSGTFGVGAPESRCPDTPIDRVSVELHLPNRPGRTFRNLYDRVREELRNLFDGEIPGNLRVHEQPANGAIHVQFDLADGERRPAVDTAFALEELVRQGGLALAGGQLVADQTLSRFTHHHAGVLQQSGAQTGRAAGVPVSMHIRPENAFQMIVFVLATSSAFLVSIFVVYVMLKRGKSTKQHLLMMGGGAVHPGALVANGTAFDPTAASISSGQRLGMGTGDKYLDYSSPIFVLSASDMKIAKDDEEQTRSK